MDEKHLTRLGEIGGLAQRHSSRTSVKLESRIVVEHGSVAWISGTHVTRLIKWWSQIMESVSWCVRPGVAHGVARPQSLTFCARTVS